MRRSLRDPNVRSLLRTAQRRVRDIQRGSPISPFPTQYPPLDPPAKRNAVLLAAAPYLNEDEAQDLDDFMQTRLSWSKSKPRTPSQTPSRMVPVPALQQIRRAATSMGGARSRGLSRQ